MLQACGGQAAKNLSGADHEITTRTAPPAPTAAVARLQRPQRTERIKSKQRVARRSLYQRPFSGKGKGLSAGEDSSPRLSSIATVIGAADCDQVHQLLLAKHCLGAIEQRIADLVVLA
jgi:hypothetical protein